MIELARYLLLVDVDVEEIPIKIFFILEMVVCCLLAWARGMRGGTCCTNVGINNRNRIRTLSARHCPVIVATGCKLQLR